MDGTDLETLMKNPSLCPSLRSPEERMRMAVGIAKVIHQCQKENKNKFNDLLVHLWGANVPKDPFKLLLTIICD